MPDITVLDPASADFERCLRAVRPDQWSSPTPCDEWDVTALVLHVVRGNAMAAAVMHGASREEGIAVMSATELGDDPVAAFRTGALDQAEAFGEPGALDRVVHHPMADLPAAQLLGFRLADLAAHTWDLARATGQDEDLDPRVVQEVWDDLQPMLPVLGGLGVFGDGASSEVGADEPLQRRLLDALGRRP